METKKIEEVTIKILESKEKLGTASAVFVAEKINAAISEKGKARIIIATGASQFEFLDHLRTENIDWSKVTVFHLDEYHKMSDQHPASFRKYLKERILAEVNPAKVYYLEGDAQDIDGVMQQYETLLKEDEIDIACIGIGENGHLAFNDPPVADFNDKKWVKLVELDEGCRQQQLGEGWFASFDEVPTHALSLTIPAILNSNVISCVVPDERKANAVKCSLYGEISEKCPGSALRTHKNTVIWLDNGAASKLN